MSRENFAQRLVAGATIFSTARRRRSLGFELRVLLLTSTWIAGILVGLAFKEFLQ